MLKLAHGISEPLPNRQAHSWVQAAAGLQGIVEKVGFPVFFDAFLQGLWAIGP